MTATTARRGSIRRWSRAAATWGAVVAIVVASAAAVRVCMRPPSMQPADVTSPSGARARAVAETLSEEIGVRYAGTTGASRAADVVEQELRAIPGLEVTRHVQAGQNVFYGWVIDYRVENVLARIPGKRRDAILVSTHFDSPLHSVGAADAAVAVGAAIEAARQLAGTAPQRSIIFLFNGGEEPGLAGAHAFLSHPWAEDVRAFVNLEAAGSAGLPILFRAGHGAGPLLDAYGAISRPVGSVLGQDIFEAGLIDSATDARVYRDAAGWPGLDLALYQDGYTYHTALDRMQRLGPGTAQGMVEAVVELVGKASQGPLTGASEKAPYYFDVLSHGWFTVGRGVAKLWSLVLVTGLVLLAIWARQSKAVRTRSLLAATAVALLGLVAGLVVAVATGAVTGWLIGNPQAWFATPVLAIVTFAAASLWGVVASQTVWAWRRARAGLDARDGVLVGWWGAAFACSVIGALMALAEIGSGYVFWVVATIATLALVAAYRAQQRGRTAPLWVGFAVMCLVVVDFGARLLDLYLPMVGRLELPFPSDPVVALVVALPALVLASFAAIWVHQPALARPSLTGVAVVVAVAIAACALVDSYDAARPKRVFAYEIVEGEAAHIELEAGDGVSLAAAGVLDLVASRTGLERRDVGFTSTAPAADAGSVDISPRQSASGEHILEIEVGAHAAALVRVEVPARRVVRLIDGPPRSKLPAEGSLFIDVIGQSDGFRASFVIRGEAPVDVTVDQVFSSRSPRMRQVLEALPPWTTGNGRTVVRTKRSVALTGSAEVAPR